MRMMMRMMMMRLMTRMSVGGCGPNQLSTRNWKIRIRMVANIRMMMMMMMMMRRRRMTMMRMMMMRMMMRIMSVGGYGAN